MPTDEELIAEFLHGSQAAMEVLVKRYYKTVFAFLFRKLGDYHLAYDLTQEVFIRVLKALSGYRADGRFEHWLIKIAVNLSRDYFRSRQFTEKTGTVTYADAGAEHRVSNLFENSLQYQEIREALSALPEEQRDAVILYYYSGYKIKEISKITKTKEATVKSRIRHALIRLQKSLSGGEYGVKR